MFSAVLADRGFISVTGEDTQSFLQGIISNDITHATGMNAVYACFLTPQGKYLADFFIYAQPDGVVLDVDKKLLPDLLKRMTMFKLRSRVVLADVSEQFSVTAVWGTHLHPEKAYADPRAAVMGYRLLSGAIDGEAGDYEAWQMQHGIAGADNFERERTTLLEANLDLLHGVSFTKGCYMGQEITARMHYRGLVKKRFLPVLLAMEKKIALETPITREGKTIGFLRGIKGRHALGLIQLEGLQGNLSCQIDDTDAQIIIPEWFDLNAVLARR